MGWDGRGGGVCNTPETRGQADRLGVGVEQVCCAVQRVAVESELPARVRAGSPSCSLWQAAGGRKHAPADAEELSGGQNAPPSSGRDLADALAKSRFKQPHASVSPAVNYYRDVLWLNTAPCAQRKQSSLDRG